MSIRLSGAPLLSWLAFGALLGGIGAAMTSAGTSPTERLAGVAAVSGGIVIVASTLWLKVGLRGSELVIRNRFRIQHLPLDRIAEVRSTMVETPLTRANGWVRLEVVTVEGRHVPLSATTGLAQDRVHDLLAKLGGDPTGQG